MNIELNEYAVTNRISVTWMCITEYKEKNKSKAKYQYNYEPTNLVLSLHLHMHENLLISPFTKWNI